MSENRDEESARLLQLPQAPDAIELRHLRAFVAVADELNFGRAAARLYLSQPALSRQIRTLERLVGCDLLRRSTHRVELTVAGQALLDRAHRLLRGLDDAVSVTRSVGGELAARIARYWEPVADLSTADADLQAFRNATEALLEKLPPPAELGVRSINAGGVPSLVLTPGSEAPVTVLHLHGGVYVMGSAFGYRPLAGALATAAEAGVLLPEYRLAPEYPFPAAVEDALRAYLWMLDSGTEPKQVTVAGDSSGGGLVLSLLLTLKQQKLPLPGSAVLLCPGIFLGRTVLDVPAGAPEPMMSLEQIRRFSAYYLGGQPLDDPVVSPLTADLSGLPPMLIQGGTGDLLIEDAHRITDHARSHGVNVRLELFPVDTHVFHLFWSFLPEAADALQQVGHFIRETHTIETIGRPGSGSNAEPA